MTTPVAATIERRLEIDAPPERVWRALTDSSEIAAWFGDSAELDLRPGGEGWFGWKKHGRFAVRVDVVDEPTRLVWSWAREAGMPIDDCPSTRVEWRLTPRAGGGTVLELTESGFADEAARQDNVGGWKHELGDLVAYLEG